MKYILSTVGTSSIEKAKLSIGNFKNESYEFFDTFPDDLIKKKNDLKKYFSSCGKPDEQNLQKFPAEIKSLVKLGCDKNTFNYLIITDTAPCRLCGEFLSDFISENLYSSTELIRIKGLTVDSANSFLNEGLKNLGRESLNILDNLEYQEVYFNLTGGFKATIPYLSIIAMLKGIPINYIYEDENNIITIPHLPLEYNLSKLKELKDIFINIEVNSSINQSEMYNNLNENNKIFFEKIDHEYTTSFWGDIFWNKYKNDYEPDEKSLPKSQLKPYEKNIKLSDHHGKDKLKDIAEKLFSSPYVESIIDSTFYQGERKIHRVIPLRANDLVKHKKCSQEGVCLIMDDKSKEGTAMLAKTTGRIFWETKKIAEILKNFY